MFILKNFITSIAYILDIALNIYTWIVIVRAALTWFSPDPYNQLYKFLCAVVDPVTDRLRKTLPFLRVGMADFSPLILILILLFLNSFLPRTLIQIASRL